MDDHELIPRCQFCPGGTEGPRCPVRFCEWVDPSSPRFRPDAGALVESVLSNPRPVHVPRVGEQGEYHEADPRYPAVTDGPEARSGRFDFAADEEDHARIVASMATCPHKSPRESCCGPIEVCGPGGSRAGLRVSVATCYPCSSDRLGIAIGRA